MTRCKGPNVTHVGGTRFHTQWTRSESLSHRFTSCHEQERFRQSSRILWLVSCHHFVESHSFWFQIEVTNESVAGQIMETEPRV